MRRGRGSYRDVRKGSDTAAHCAPAPGGFSSSHELATNLRLQSTPTCMQATHSCQRDWHHTRTRVRCCFLPSPPQNNARFSRNGQLGSSPRCCPCCAWCGSSSVIHSRAKTAPPTPLWHRVRPCTRRPQDTHFSTMFPLHKRPQLAPDAFPLLITKRHAGCPPASVPCTAKTPLSFSLERLKPVAFSKRASSAVQKISLVNSGAPCAEKKLW